MRKEFESIIKIQQMDREAINHFTLSEVLPMCTNDYAIKMYDVIYDDDNDVYYAHTGIGLVVFPRHLNETLEEISYLIDDEEAGHYAFRPYSYTFGDRHGYSAKFYTVDTLDEKKECKYIDSCYEKDCALCPHYKYCTPTYEEGHTTTSRDNKYTETDTDYEKYTKTDAYKTNYTTTCTGTDNPYQE